MYKKLILLMLLAACDQPVSKPMPGPSDTGFRPAKDGFMFENYGNMNVTNLTSAEVRRMFGDKACGSLANGACTLTPPVQQFMDLFNQAMNGGHCYGFSHLALNFYSGKLKPSDFGGDSTIALAKDGNEKLQREIAYWMSTQAVQDGTIKDLSPKDVVARLRQSFAKGKDSDQYTLGIYKIENGKRSGGHAITPYAVQDVDANNVRLMVYDNNFPNQERAIDIDVGANKWRYTAATNPSEPAGLYEGDATTKTMTLAPISGALGMLSCPFCGTMAAATSGERRVLANGLAGLTVTDAQGRRVSDTLNEIPGAQAVPVFSDGLYADTPAPSFRMPGGSDLTVTIDGQGMSAESEESVSVLGPGYTLAVKGVNLPPGQIDKLQISAAGDMIKYTTTGMETPTLVLGVELAGADYEFDIRVSGDADGQQAVLRLDLASGKLGIQIIDMDGTEYAITVRRIDENGVSEFSHTGNTLGGSDTVYLSFAAWAGQGQPMSAEVDKNSDGSIDQMLSLSDSQ